MDALEGTTARKRVYLMRHGHVDYFSREVVESRDPRLARLTAHGEAEANAAGEALSSIEFDIAVCSGLRRTRQTAERVLSHLNTPPPQLQDISALEELHSGQYIEFESREALAATMTAQFENAHSPGASFLEGGELFSDAMVRIVEAMEMLLLQNRWRNALVVAHEGVNRLILSWMCNAALNASASFEQDTGCINILDFDLMNDPATGNRMIGNKIIKSINLTPDNYIKHGMNLRSLEAIFSR